MKISECKKKMTLPKNGTRVKTKLIYTRKQCEGFLVSEKYINVRSKTYGKYIGFSCGSGGDVWFVKHDDGTIGAYMYTEVFDRRK